MTRKLQSTSRHWKPADFERLKLMWPKYPKKAILDAFPGRSWAAIQAVSTREGYRRARKFTPRYRRPADDVMADLRHRRQEMDLTATQVSHGIGYTTDCIAGWERGAHPVTYPALQRWCAFLGMELTIKPILKMRAAA